MQAATDEPHLTDADELAVVEVRGDDRLRWLQGQITQDVYAIKDGRTIHGFHLDAQGRIRAELRVVADASSLLALVERRLAAALVSDLDRRIVMEDVELRVRDDLAVLGIHGRGSQAIALASGAIVVTSDRYGIEGAEVVVPRAELAAFRERLVAAVRSAGGDVVDDATLDRARVRAGMPRFGVDFGENSLPQETGLHRRTVSFTKGCYVGQEPVVMIEHRGKPPRRTCVVHVEGEIRVPCELARADGSVAGRCTSAVPDGEGTRAIAVLKRSDAEGEPNLTADGKPARIVGIVDLAPTAP